MKGKRIEGRVVNVLWGHFRSDCDGAVDDWTEDVFKDTMPELIEYVAKFDVSNSGSWYFYKTTIVRFEYDGKKYEHNLYPQEACEEIDKRHNVYETVGYISIFREEYDKQQALWEKQRQEQVERNRAREQRKRKEQYEELKEEFGE